MMMIMISMMCTDSLAVRLGYVRRTANITVYVPHNLGEKVNILGEDIIGNSKETSPYKHVSDFESLPS
jgi:hypothetical protein